MKDVNVDGAAAIARACQEAKTPRFIHVSSIRAHPDAVSELSRTKAEGQARVQHEFPMATIVRPSSIFGTQDRLMNGIGRFPMLGDGKQIRYPLHISNLADALMLLIRGHRAVEGQTYELVGPKGYTYRRLVELFAHAAMCPTRLISLSPRLFWCYGKIFPEIRRAPFPYDTILQLKESETGNPGAAAGMGDLGFARLETLEDHLLAIARRYRRTEDFGTPLIFPPELLADSTKL